MGWLRSAVERVREFAYAERAPRRRGPAREPKVGVALGGGFARGIAHLGVLHALEQNKIPIDYIVGTSAGALAGVAFASGLPFDEVVRRAAAIKFGNFGQWRFSWMGLASNERLESYPERFLGVKTFEELRLPAGHRGNRSDDRRGGLLHARPAWARRCVARAPTRRCSSRSSTRGGCWSMGSWPRPCRSRARARWAPTW